MLMEETPCVQRLAADARGLHVASHLLAASQVAWVAAPVVAAAAVAVAAVA